MDIDVEIVRRLVAAQFPQWAHLEVRPVHPGGWDNRTFRLGDDLSVRMPSAERYVPQVDKEHRWLPVLAPRVSLAIPSPVGRGAPGAGYPWPWSIYRWIDGESAMAAHIGDPARLAEELAEFLLSLQRVECSEGPPPGDHNFHRGGRLAIYDGETRRAARALSFVDTSTVERVWDRALASLWTSEPVWVHGDIHPSNLLVSDGRLAAVIDFGGLAAGDPAADYAIAWTFFGPNARGRFRRVLSVDDDTWDRSRGWALWKTLTTIESSPERSETDRRVVEEILRHG